MNPLTVAGLVTIALLTVALGVTGKWAQHEAGKRAEAEASARQWMATAQECSDSVEKAAKAGELATRRAQEALKAARLGSARGAAEIERLRSAMGQKGTCEAAVQQVRKGLGAP